MSQVTRLALGTVQFGVKYGVANRAGKVPKDEVAKILSIARAACIDTLDTAMVYGESETVLGAIGVTDWRVVTKIPHLPSGIENVESWLEQAARSSLERLRVGRLYGLLLHRPSDLLGADGARLFAGLVRLRSEGVVQGIGVSIYDPAELDQLIGRFRFDVVQAPFSIIDRRLEASGWLSRLKDAGVEVHARSVFLQGLLLLNDSGRPAYFAKWAPLWSRWQSWLRESDLSPVEACLRFALSRPEIDRVVVGADNVAQITEVVSIASTARSLHAPDNLLSVDEELVNPSRWPPL